MSHSLPAHGQGQAMSAVVCSNFRPNLWRPTTCANCLRPKPKHARPGDRRSAAPERDATEPPPLVPLQRVEEREGESETPQVPPVCRPYAVVQLEADQDALAAGEDRRRRAPSCSHLPSSRSCERLEADGKSRSRSFCSVAFAAPKPSARPSAAPKRKAPPPPLSRPPPTAPKPKPQQFRPTRKRQEEEDVVAASPRDAQLGPAGPQPSGEEGTAGHSDRAAERRSPAGTRSTSIGQAASPRAARGQEGRVGVSAPVKPRVTPSTGQVGSEAKQQSETVYTTVQVVAPAPALPHRSKGRRAAPKKPPRTLSTFFDLPEEQCASGSVEYSELICGHPIPSAAGNQLQVQLVQLMGDSVQRVYAKFLENVLRLDSLWEVTWQHLDLCSPSAASYKGVDLDLEVSYIALLACCWLVVLAIRRPQYAGLAEAMAPPW